MTSSRLGLILLLFASQLAAATATIKFVDGSSTEDISVINSVLVSHGATATRLFAHASEAHLNRFYRVTFPDEKTMNDALPSLAAFDVVEYAEGDRGPAPPPAIDIAPMTPSLVFSQSYRASAPIGLGFNDAQWAGGGDGSAVRIADVEGGWFTNHEDLDPPSSIDGVSSSDQDHGTAVIGLLRAADNAYGITGVAPAADLVLVSPWSPDGSYNLPNAINVAASRLRIGDVMLVEQQGYCYTDVCPAEWDRAIFAAIQSAVRRGIIVVEPAGNGGFNLDESRFAEHLTGDSGAIMVGAGTSTSSHDALAMSNYGARVDVQGFGENVETLGYGDAFNPLPDPRQRYTAHFSGTSSASAMVAGAAAVLQSVRKSRGLTPLLSTQMRAALIGTGTAQGGGGHVGPLPNVTAAINALSIPAPIVTATPAPHRRASGH